MINLHSDGPVFSGKRLKAARRLNMISAMVIVMNLVIAMVMASWVPAESECAENPKRGLLVLEDPKEKKRYAEYEIAPADIFSIKFIHSVNKSPVIDFFEVREDGIYGVKTVYYGFGAGVPTELEEGQTLTYGEDGSMIISGMEIKMDNLIYRVGTVSDHILELQDGSEISLRELCGRNARVAFYYEADPA